MFRLKRRILVKKDWKIIWKELIQKVDVHFWISRNIKSHTSDLLEG